MAESEPRRAGATAWDFDAARKRAGITLPDQLAERSAGLRRLLAQWALAEVAPGRLVPWLAVAFGTGIVLYFTAGREPSLWAALGLAALACAIAFLARRSAIGLALALGFAGIAAGFAVAKLNTARIAHPVLRYPASSVAISGFVEAREERERGDRIVVRIHSIEGRRLDQAPDRVRISVRKDTAPAVGSFVTLKAHLSPPLSPLRPGGYDFAREMYFARLGASGYALGKITVAPAPVAPGAWLRFAALIDGMRETIDKRIRAVVPGDEGSIASAARFHHDRHRARRCHDGPPCADLSYHHYRRS
ncbi:MAG: DUF4131 domain-containing protein, partial [Pseudolabrys sp.]